MRKHTGDLFRCEECDYSSAYKKDLESHMRKHTGDLFRCDECDYTSTRNFNLKNHMRKKHNGDVESPLVPIVSSI